VDVDSLGFWVLPIATSGVAIALLALEVRAFLRHKHMSFLLLAIATACGLLYLAGLYGLSYYVHLANQPVPSVWLYTGAILQAAAILFGFWGTASLIQAYDRVVRTRA
jgi:hypothetical protein